MSPETSLLHVIEDLESVFLVKASRPLCRGWLGLSELGEQSDWSHEAQSRSSSLARSFRCARAATERTEAARVDLDAQMIIERIGHLGLGLWWSGSTVLPPAHRVPQVGQVMYHSSEPCISIIRPTFSPLDGHHAFRSSSFWRIASSLPTMSRSSLLLMDTSLCSTPDNQFLSVRGGRIVVMSSFPIRSAAPEKAVPPGRIGYDLDADVLLLHTIQTTRRAPSRKGSPGASTRMRLGLTTTSRSVSGSALNGANSGESTLPQWCRSKSSSG